MTKILDFLTNLVLASTLVPLSVACAQTAKNPSSFKAKDGTTIQVEEVASGLKHPWALTFLPDRRILVTERATGKLYYVSNGKLSQSITGTPEVLARGQGGLMDVALDPNFKDNNFVYLSYAKPGEGGKATTALGRGTLSGQKIKNFEVLFEQKPYISGSNHFGNRIEFSPDGKYLYLALGERFQFEPAQDLSNHLGTVIRIHPDGSVPKDNPFEGKQRSADEIWSYGHRNIEAMAFQPRTGSLWVVEMGPKDGDELNRIQKGANYGWPTVSWGNHYDGKKIPDPPTQPKFADATKHWTPVISPSGMEFYEGNMFPQWKDSAFIGGLSSQALIRLAFNGNNVTEEERFKMNARIRDVAIADDGSIYVITDENNGRILRLSEYK